MSFTDICLQVKPLRSVVEARDPKTRERLKPQSFEAYARERSLEVETYGETKQPAKHTLNVGTYQPKGDYVTVRNIEVSQLPALRKFGRVLRGYPMKPRDFYRQAELRKPLNEKPVCPICKTDKHVHWIGRDHWTCTADHLPQHFGMLRLT